MRLANKAYRLDRSVLRWIPLRLILILVAITGTALTALLAVSFERERVLMEAIGARDIIGRLVGQALSSESYVQDFDIQEDEAAEIKVPLRISTCPLLETSGQRVGFGVIADNLINMGRVLVAQGAN